MKNAQFNQGVMRCWNCGSTGFKMKRTGRAKLFGLVALATKKKAKCLQCGRYNDTA